MVTWKLSVTAVGNRSHHQPQLETPSLPRPAAGGAAAHCEPGAYYTDRVAVGQHVTAACPGQTHLNSSGERTAAIVLRMDVIARLKLTSTVNGAAGSEPQRRRTTRLGQMRLP